MVITIMKNNLDCLFVHSDSSTKAYQSLSGKYSGIEPPTWSLLLAESCRSKGFKVGILDADVYGPSLPKLFSINEKPDSDGQTLKPIVKYDIQCMSIGFLTDEQTPMIWRGPMVTSAITVSYTHLTLPTICSV